MAEPKPGTPAFRARAKARRDANKKGIVTRRVTPDGLTLVEIFEGISTTGGGNLQIRGPIFRPIEAALKGVERIAAKSKKKKKKKKKGKK